MLEYRSMITLIIPDYTYVAQSKPNWEPLVSGVAGPGVSSKPVEAAIVPFTRKRRLDHLKAIRLYGMKIKPETWVNNFEIALDQKLLWKAHAKNIRTYTSRKAARVLMTYRFIVEKNSGWTSKILHCNSSSRTQCGIRWLRYYYRYKCDVVERPTAQKSREVQRSGRSAFSIALVKEAVASVNCNDFSTVYLQQLADDCTFSDENLTTALNRTIFGEVPLRVDEIVSHGNIQICTAPQSRSEIVKAINALKEEKTMGLVPSLRNYLLCPCSFCRVT